MRRGQAQTPYLSRGDRDVDVFDEMCWRDRIWNVCGRAWNGRHYHIITSHDFTFRVPNWDAELNKYPVSHSSLVRVPELCCPELLYLARLAFAGRPPPHSALRRQRYRRRCMLVIPTRSKPLCRAAVVARYPQRGHPCQTRAAQETCRLSLVRTCLTLLIAPALFRKRNMEIPWSVMSR